MQPELWARVEEVVHQAIESPDEERPALLEVACGGDSDLRREVESLLAVLKDATFTGSPGFADAIRILEQHDARSSAGRTIGAYRVLREIGRGGMGNVYLGTRADNAFQKMVAIKIIRRGLDSDELIQRFHAERQILAGLDHPNIARLLDGGRSDDGLPYFVMEYIEGEPIDQYCDRRRLTVTERLRLFQGVCSAVHYVHQNLVIHRDIKPGNVLVTREGVPRLLDFGIAKLMAESASGDATVTMLRPLTPDFASPEQIRGEAVTTASDVYSLGVLLYLLLAGCRPFGRGSASTAVGPAPIHEEASEKPSAAVMKEGGAKQAPTPDSVSSCRQTTPERLSRHLRGDLDNIVLMALRHDPRRRYASAEQFSDDIARYLANLPVKARPDTRRYRCAKFLRRNRGWVAAAALFFLTLAGGIAATLWQARIAREQRDVARRQLQLARVEQAKSARINAFLQDMVGYSGVGGGTLNHKYDATVAEMLDDAAQRVETELEDQPAVKAELLRTIGATYLGQVKIAPAERYLGEAYDLNLKLYGPAAIETSAVMIALGGLGYRKGDYAGADAWFQKGLPACRRHAADAGFEVRVTMGVLSDAAFVKRALGRFEEAGALWRESLTYAPRLPVKYRSVGIVPKTYLAQLATDRGDVEQADALASEASKELRQLGTDRFALAQSLIDLGNVRRMETRYAEARPLIQEGTGLYAAVQGNDHPNVAYGLVSLANVNYYEGNYAMAEQNARRALSIMEEKLPAGTSPYSAVYGVLGAVLNKTGRSREAERLLRDSLAIRQKSTRTAHIAFSQGSLGECLLTQKRYAEAEPLLVASYQGLAGAQVARSPFLKQARERLGALYAAWGKTNPYR